MEDLKIEHLKEFSQEDLRGNHDLEMEQRLIKFEQLKFAKQKEAMDICSALLGLNRPLKPGITSTWCHYDPHVRSCRLRDAIDNRLLGRCLFRRVEDHSPLELFRHLWSSEPETPSPLDHQDEFGSTAKSISLFTLSEEVAEEKTVDFFVSFLWEHEQPWSGHDQSLVLYWYLWGQSSFATCILVAFALAIIGLLTGLIIGNVYFLFWCCRMPKKCPHCSTYSATSS